MRERQREERRARERARESTSIAGEDFLFSLKGELRVKGVHFSGKMKQGGHECQQRIKTTLKRKKKTLISLAAITETLSKK